MSEFYYDEFFLQDLSYKIAKKEYSMMNKLYHISNHINFDMHIDIKLLRNSTILS